MTIHFEPCRSDEDYAAFCRYFIANRKQFHSAYTLEDALLHLLEHIRDARILLVLDGSDQVVGWGHYMLANEQHEYDAEGHIAFIPSTILSPEYRQSRIFFNGLQKLVTWIGKETPQANTVRFAAVAEDAYLNRLYSKFAEPCRKEQGPFGDTVIYSADMETLRRYLRLNGAKLAFE